MLRERTRLKDVLIGKRRAMVFEVGGSCGEFGEDANQDGIELGLKEQKKIAGV